MAFECSVIVPLYNKEQSLPTFHLRLAAALKQLAIPYEIIYVDNGSTDRTADLIAELHARDREVKGIILSRHFSRQAALAAGLEASNGRSVITIDGNLEDPPEVIPQLIDAWHEGYEVVFARCRHVSPCRKAVGWLCHRLLRMVSEIPIPTDTGELTLMDRRAVEELNLMSERTRLMTGLRSWVGFRQQVVEYERPLGLKAPAVPSVTRQLRTVIEGVFAFSNVPLRLISVLGVVVVVMALIAMGASVFGTTGGNAGGTSMIVAASALGFLGGIQLLCMGVVGEYLVRIYREVRGRPLYITRQRIGFQPHPRPVPNVVHFLHTDAARIQEEATANRLAEIPSLR